MVLVLALAACSSGEEPRATTGANDNAGANATLDGSDAAAREKVFVDVRTPEEFAAGHVEGAINIPHTEMPERWRELEPYRGDSIIVYCRTGRRSAIALEVLDEQGFEFTRNAGSLEAAMSGR